MIGPSIGLLKGPYLARVLSNELVEGADNRWLYKVQFCQNIPIETVEWTGGGNVGTLESCINIHEIGNNAQLSMGITKDDLPGDFELQPVPDDAGVILWLIGGGYGVFTYPNQFDGTCEEIP